MTIPFVRDFEFEYETLAQLSPLIQRVIANNPGPFTYTGTGVYIIGEKNVAIVRFMAMACKPARQKGAKCASRPVMI